TLLTVDKILHGVKNDCRSTKHPRRQASEARRQTAFRFIHEDSLNDWKYYTMLRNSFLMKRTGPPILGSYGLRSTDIFDSLDPVRTNTRTPPSVSVNYIRR